MIIKKVFSKKLKQKIKFPDSNEKTICRPFHILAQLPFTTSEMELDYYHQKRNIWVPMLECKGY